MSFAQFIGSRIVDRRRELQLDKAALARRLGVPETTLAGWEAGAELLSPQTLTRLASALHCRISYFFDEPLKTNSETTSGRRSQP